MNKIIPVIFCCFITASILTGCSIKKEDNNSSNSSTLSSNSNIEELTSLNSNENSEKTYDNSGISFSDNYVEYENIKIAFQGHEYVFNESTLQDFIDNGVEFKNLNIEELEENYKDGSTLNIDYEVEISPFETIYFKFDNFSEGTTKIKDCRLQGINFSILNDNSREKYQNNISLAFPLNLTKDDLLKNAGEPFEINEYETGNSYCHYRKEMDNLDVDYSFDFDKNNVLKNISISMWG